MIKFQTIGYRFCIIGYRLPDLVPHCDRMFDQFPIGELIKLGAKLVNGGIHSIIVSSNMTSDDICKKLGDSVKEAGLSIYGIREKATPGICEQIYDHRRYDDNPQVLLADYLDLSDYKRVEALEKYLLTRKLAVVFIENITKAS